MKPKAILTKRCFFSSFWAAEYLQLKLKTYAVTLAGVRVGDVPCQRESMTGGGGPRSAVHGP